MSNESLQLLAVPSEETFDGTWPFEARYTEAPGFNIREAVDRRKQNRLRQPQNRVLRAFGLSSVARLGRCVLVA